MVTNGSPNRWCRRNSASCNNTTRSPNSTTPKRPNASPTVSLSSTGRKSSIAGQVRSIPCSANCSTATPCIGSLIRPSSPPTCCSKVAQPWPACTAHCSTTRSGPSPPRTSSTFSAANGTAGSMAKSTPTTKTSAGWHSHQAPHEQQLAEDVRQVRTDPPGGNGHQQPEGVLGLSHPPASRRYVLGGLLSHDQERGFLGRLSRAGVGLQPPLPGRLGGSRRPDAGLPRTATTHRAQSGRGP